MDKRLARTLISGSKAIHGQGRTRKEQCEPLRVRADCGNFYSVNKVVSSLPAGNRISFLHVALGNYVASNKPKNARAILLPVENKKLFPGPGPGPEHSSSVQTGQKYFLHKAYSFFFLC